MRLLGEGVTDAESAKVRVVDGYWVRGGSWMLKIRMPNVREDGEGGVSGGKGVAVVKMWCRCSVYPGGVNYNLNRSTEGGEERKSKATCRVAEDIRKMS